MSTISLVTIVLKLRLSRMQLGNMVKGTLTPRQLTKAKRMTEMIRSAIVKGCRPLDTGKGLWGSRTDRSSTTVV